MEVTTGNKKFLQTQMKYTDWRIRHAKAQLKKQVYHHDQVFYEKHIEALKVKKQGLEELS